MGKTQFKTDDDRRSWIKRNKMRIEIEKRKQANCKKRQYSLFDKDEVLEEQLARTVSNFQDVDMRERNTEYDQRNSDSQHHTTNQRNSVTRLELAIIKYSVNKRCSLCNEEFNVIDEFIEHFKFVHKYELFECRMCPFHCSTYIEFSGHLADNHRNAVASCGNVPEKIKAELCNYRNLDEGPRSHQTCNF